MEGTGEEGKREVTQKEEAGCARIKEEFLLKDYKPKVVEEYLDPEVKKQLEEERAAENSKENGDVDLSSPPAKRKKLKGRNKKRPVNSRESHGIRLCSAVKEGKECKYGEKCTFSHDVKSFIESKPKDISENCYIFEKYGYCKYGVTCRFAVKHLTEDYQNIANEELSSQFSERKDYFNIVPAEVKYMLQRKKYDFTKAQVATEAAIRATKNKRDNLSQVDGVEAEPTFKSVGPVTDEGEIRLRPAERKKIDFSDKLYLAPLTTVGNLPFRRVCKEYGADVTCGEMAMCNNILQGTAAEWALLRRHQSEDLFGVQVCGGFTDTMTRCAQLLGEQTQVDFIDINCGCPLDMVFKKGEGSALIGKANRLEEILMGMSAVTDLPITVKMRTGIYDNKNLAHSLIGRLKDCGVSMVAVHGRSREMRYTKKADWDYIKVCAEAARPMPLFGNGDILSFEEADLHKEVAGVSGVMLARGALIKPWLFTEIKERRHWDISAEERLDMLRRYVNYGLEHWGSDQQGVESTRRFLLEWLSFLHRYIPVGVLERVPQKINEKPPPYFCRNDLETLMASSYCGDWIKISEMLLGPVPASFNFLPKHKANAFK